MKKFLLLFALIISGMGLFAQDAASATKVTDDDYFWIEEENITQTSASFIIHSIYDDFFYCKVYTQDEFDSFEWDYDVYYATIEDEVIVEANQTFTAHNLKPLTSYVAVAANSFSEYNSYRFSTLAAPSAGISIEVTDVTETTVSFSAIPNSNTEKFYVTVIGKTDFDSYSEKELIDKLISTTTPLSEGGEYTWSGLNPGTKYVIVAVAVNEYGDPSELVSASFTTEEGIPEDGWWTVDYNDYSLDYVAFSATECAVRGNTAPTSPTTINIPSEVSKDGKNYKVVQIYDNAFKSWKNAISFNLPTSIKVIGKYAFSECTSMDNLPIPESVEIIGANAFEKCSRLVTVNMSTTVKEIGEKAFFECKDLGTVTFAENSVINKIADNAFLDCSSLYKITIPGSVSELGEGVFKNCTGLKDVTFGDNSKLVKLKDSTFENCEKLKNVTFGKNSSLTSINENLFSDSPNLESIVFGDNAKLGIVEENAFKDHAKLSKVAFGKNSVLHTIYDYSFQGCTSLTSIEIPSSVSLLGRSAFEGCSKLPSFVVPEGVTSIGNSTFKDCTSLKSFEISSTVTTIPNYAFSGCTSLAKIICKATTVPETGDEIFEGVPSNMIIYVPEASFSSYQSAEPWNEYTLKAMEDGDEPEEPGDEPEEPGEGVEENAMTFTLYPNPVESNLTIATNEVITEVNIYSITGVMVYSSTNVNNNVINVSDLNAGIYFISIKSENGETTKRFIKK